MTSAEKLSTGGKLSTAPRACARDKDVKKDGDGVSKTNGSPRSRARAYEAFYDPAIEDDAEAEEAREREHSASWLSDRGKGAAAIRRCASARADIWRKREAAAIMRVWRTAPHLLPVLRLILKNGSNREKSICEIMAKIGTRKK